MHVTVISTAHAPIYSCSPKLNLLLAKRNNRCLRKQVAVVESVKLSVGGQDRALMDINMTVFLPELAVPTICQLTKSTQVWLSIRRVEDSCNA